MAERLSKKVRRFCEANGIKVPIGFDRHPASRYVIVELTDPPKLIARTWLTQADTIYYIEHLASEVPHRILDFREFDELYYDGGKRLKRVGKFASP